jgi:hypothetical protein
MVPQGGGRRKGLTTSVPARKKSLIYFLVRGLSERERERGGTGSEIERKGEGEG